MTRLVTVINHGVGNTVSIINLLNKIGVQPRLISNIDEFMQLKENDLRMIVPGVGSYDRACKSLSTTGLKGAITEFAEQGGSILGICLGMQLLFEGSEEGDAAGLGLLDGTLVKIKKSERSRVPHVGWEKILIRKSDPIFEGIREPFFYHNHSYALPFPNDAAIATIELDKHYVVTVRRRNVIGVQFHPEKSHSAGEQMIRNFVSL